ncbi:hypothetical protein [Thalassomonas actiniarum]|uniref:Uncharacterized protein n=1 Tax=Thalassomonas actiniarum TaxID=485447 RepID=A0AAE9YRK6_9GAMM|nr:hypothetical protein [Thalassomonas actiniarum]WDD99935.1 hypothetical protein SG35_004545 [Thalassomonas actiniarum]
MKAMIQYPCIIILTTLCSAFSHQAMSSDLTAFYQNCTRDLDTQSRYQDCQNILAAENLDNTYDDGFTAQASLPTIIVGTKFTFDLAKDLEVTTLADVLEDPMRYGYYRTDGYCADSWDWSDDDCRLEDLKRQYDINAVYEASAQVPVVGDNGQLLNFDVLGQIHNAVVWFSVRCGTFREIDIDDTLAISQSEVTSGSCDSLRIYFKPRHPFNYQDPQLEGFLTVIISESF